MEVTVHSVVVWNHHCETPVLGNFFVSSPKFFSARVEGQVVGLLGAEGPQKWTPRAKARGLRKKSSNGKFLVANKPDLWHEYSTQEPSHDNSSEGVAAFVKGYALS